MASQLGWFRGLQAVSARDAQMRRVPPNEGKVDIYEGKADRCSVFSTVSVLIRHLLVVSALHLFRFFLLLALADFGY